MMMIISGTTEEHFGLVTASWRDRQVITICVDNSDGDEINDGDGDDFDDGDGDHPNVRQLWSPEPPLGLVGRRR